MESDLPGHTGPPLPDLSAEDELTAFRLYYTHQQGCGRCYPAAGDLCSRGRKLHDIWKRAEQAMLASAAAGG